MSLYTLLLFLHVSGAICLFIGFGIWLFGITAIARATQVEQIRTLADLLVMTRMLVPVSAFVVIAAGLTMAVTTWGIQTSWIAVALGSLVVIGPIGAWVIDPKVRAIAVLARTLPDGPLPHTLTKRTHDFVLRTSLHTALAMLFGIVFLMTSKPAFTTAIVAMVISAFLGLASGLWLGRARRASPSDRFHRHKEKAS
jgi:hypothetical protein